MTSNPWLPTYRRSGIPTSLSTSRRSRPLTMTTVCWVAKRSRSCRGDEERTAFSGPEKAVLSSSTRQLLERLATQPTVVIVSGRDRLDVERLVGIPDLLYVGSHGFDVMGHMKDGRRVSHQIGEDHLPAPVSYTHLRAHETKAN